MDSISYSHITKTCLYKFETSLLFSKTGVHRGIHLFFFFVISAQKLRLWVRVREAVLTSTHDLCFEQKYEKYQNFLSEIFHFSVVKFSVYLNRYVLVVKKKIFQALLLPIAIHA